MSEKYSPEWTAGDIGCTYYVSTVKGHWGKGKTLFEAATNANVTQAPVHANVWRFPNVLVDSITPMDMGVEWQWSEAALVESDTVRVRLQAMFRMCKDLMIKLHKRSSEVHLVHQA